LRLSSDHTRKATARMIIDNMIVVIMA